MTAAAAKAIARKGVDLKELKATQKGLLKQAALVPALLEDRDQLASLRETSAATSETLRLAQRRIKALEKELGIEPGAKIAKKPASSPAPAVADGQAAGPSDSLAASN